MDHTTIAKSRITVLRELLGLSQKKFSQNVGITQGALSQLETGKSKLSLDSIQKISLAFSVNCNWLINGKGDIFMKGISKNKVPVRKSIVTMDLGDNVLIPMIREEAHAGYIKGCQNTEYLSTLDVYKIPGYESGNYRLFEISGDSMIPIFYPREIVVSEQVEDWENIENGTICIIITEDGIVAKRIYFYEEDRNLVILKSDNSTYKTYSISTEDILEIWKVQAKITNMFATEQPSDNRKIDLLASDIRSLKSQMAKLLNSDGTGKMGSKKRK